ncbi:MAG TPA: hypothetical protein PL028_01680 [Bacteroidales bacterium]|nr:hypothetical protein [Bacteroidales bacterium]
MKTTLSILLNIFFVFSITYAQKSETIYKKNIFTPTIIKTLDSCNKQKINKTRLNSIIKQADISANPLNLGIAYLGAALYEKDRDSILNNLEKSISWFNKFSPDSLIIFPDCILSYLNNNIPNQKGYFYNQLSGKLHDKLPAYSIIYNKRAAKLNEMENNYPWVGFAFLNISLTYADSYNDYEKANEYIDSSIYVWQKIQDTMQLANVYKYKGYLLGKMHKFQEAKDIIKIAVSLYNLKIYDRGVAVSYFDLAKVYEEENIIDSSFILLEKAKKIWLIHSDTFRIVGINNALINLHIKNKNFEKTLPLIDENDKLIQKETFQETPLLEFYKLRIAVYKETKQQAKLEKAEADLENLEKSL